jgi:hypothetical protein
MRRRKTVKGMVVSPAQLDKLIEEATVDCNNDAEQVSGLFTMIEENLALPFAARVLGAEVSWSRLKGTMIAASKPRMSTAANANASI